MALLNGQLQHFGAVTKLAQASRDHRCRSVAVAGLYRDASPLAEKMAVDLCRSFALSSTLFHFAPGHHRWRQFRPGGVDVYQEVPAPVHPPGTNKYGAPSLLTLEAGPPPRADDSSEVELVADAPLSLVRATIDELEQETSMLVLSAPPLLGDPTAAMALSLVPRVILCVPAQTDREDLFVARKALEAMNVELIGSVMVGYRNPLPKWLDFLLGYR